MAIEVKIGKLEIRSIILEIESDYGISFTDLMNAIREYKKREENKKN